MKPKMTHICLHVAALEKCTRFYREYLEMEIVEKRSGTSGESVYLAPNDTAGQLVLQLMGGGPVTSSIDNIRQSESHLGFDVGSIAAVDRIAARAREEGILLWEPDAYMPGAWLCGILDPNGNCVEFSCNHPLPDIAAMPHTAGEGLNTGEANAGITIRGVT